MWWEHTEGRTGKLFGMCTTPIMNQHIAFERGCPLNLPISYSNNVTFGGGGYFFFFFGVLLYSFKAVFSIVWLQRLCPVPWQDSRHRKLAPLWELSYLFTVLNVIYVSLFWVKSGFFTPIYCPNFCRHSNIAEIQSLLSNWLSLLLKVLSNFYHFF